MEAELRENCTLILVWYVSFRFFAKEAEAQYVLSTEVEPILFRLGKSLWSWQVLESSFPGSPQAGPTNMGSWKCPLSALKSIIVQAAKDPSQFTQDSTGFPYLLKPGVSSLCSTEGHFALWDTANITQELPILPARAQGPFLVLLTDANWNHASQHSWDWI